MVEEKKRTKLIPPETAVRNAWARTSQLSSNEAVRLDADRAKKQMDNIKKWADEKDDEEKKYVNQVYSAIESAYRNLVTAINGRDLNFAEVDKLREKQMENLEYASTFSSELQSLVPRISGMTVGGATGGALVSALVESLFPPSLKHYAMPLVLAFGAAIGYLAHGMIVVPWVRRQKQRELIKSDHDRILYYRQYVTRVRTTLKALYDEVDELHLGIFEGTYDEKADANKVVDRVLVGMEPSMCKYVADHIGVGRNGKCLITPDFWSMCETNQDVEKCKYWPERRRK